VTTPAGTPTHPQFRIIDGPSIRFTESEGRNDDALLLSPWPESLFALEPIWAPLADHAHLVAIDLPGFCHSERRDDLLSSRRWASSRCSTRRPRCVSATATGSGW
jgi:pimeloyl-ACP methyl ester carboxylesterase